MKKYIFSFLLISSIGWSGNEIKSQTNVKPLVLKLQNKLSISRVGQIVEISAKDIENKVPSSFVIKDVSNHEIPYQWVYEGNSKPVKLILQADFAPDETLQLQIVAGQPKTVVTKTYARFIAERFEDYAWENDKIAFRMYGKALEKKPSEMASGLDVWAKKTPAMVVNKWYKGADYHKDHGEGLDFFSVGMTLGAGDAGVYLGDSLNFLGNYTGHEMLDSGALRSSFKLNYAPVKKGNYTISAVKIITLDAGSQLNKEEVIYTFAGGSELPIIAGIVHWDGKGISNIDASKDFATYWEPAHGSHGTIGTAILFPRKDGKIVNQKQHLAAVKKLKSGQSWTFYNGAAWDKAGEITSADDWNKYLSNFRAKIDAPIKVKISK